MFKDKRRAIVIGGGIAGPATCLFLKKAGLSPVLYEAHPFVRGAGGGLGLAPNGMKILAAFGVADVLKERSELISTFSFRNGKGKALGQVLIDPARYGAPMLAMSRALLVETLVDMLREERIEAHYERRLSRIEERSSGVIAHFEDGSSVEGDILIGADGVRSVVRRYLLPDVEAEYTGLIGIGGFSPLADLPRLEANTMTFVFGQRGFFGFSGADRESAMWWTNLFREEPFTSEDIAHPNRAALGKELLQRFGDYFSPVPEIIRTGGAIQQVNVYDVRVLPEWHRGRVVLIGDAAHAVSPNSGQGASIALEDAMYLAKLLRDLPYEDAFPRFEQERKPRAEKVVSEGRRRGGDKAIVPPLQQKIRELMMRVMIPLVGVRSDRWLFDYDIDW